MAIIERGWRTLPHGAGGLIIGFDIAPDGTMVCRSDTNGCYLWSGTVLTPTNPADRWIPLMSKQSLGSSARMVSAAACYEVVIAPSLTTHLYAIMPDTGYVYTNYLYYSIDSGTTWTKTSLELEDADANASNNKFGKQRIAVDPENPNVIYVGMSPASGNAYGLYKSTDGTTFSAVTDIAHPTQSPGVCGIWFDRAYTRANGTIAVGGQQVSRRVIVPVAGVGIYETLDGGQTWTETAVTPFGGTGNISVWNASMNYDGVYYCLTSDQAWRYSGAGGTWERIDNQTNFTARVGSSWLSGNGHASAILADPRDGQQGYLSITGPQGVGNGVTSSNGNAATIADVAWTGRTGGQAPVLQSAAYDLPWFNYRPQGLGAFLACGAAAIDHNGQFWWAGNQGFWYTEALPNYPNTSGYVLTSNSMGRGMELSVSQDIMCPPGATHPVQGSQDVGVMQGTFTSIPSNYHKSGKRMDADAFAYAASDPSFVVAQIDEENVYWANVGSHYFSGYSTDYGRTGTWVEYAKQPPVQYQAQIVGSISSGVLTVDSISAGVGGAKVLLAQVIWTGFDATTGGPSGESGRITAQLTGDDGGPGTYSVSGGVDRSTMTLYLIGEAFTGFIAAVDHDHHICCPFGGVNASNKFVPIYTANATGDCDWSFTNLPRSNWGRRSYQSGWPTRPFACGQGSDLGTVWAARNEDDNHCLVYKSTDSGATFTQIADITPFTTSGKGAILEVVPGYPQHLWLTAACTGGNSKIWRSTDGGVNWSVLTPPVTLVQAFCLGAAETPGNYPTLYCMGYPTFGGEKTIHYSQNEGASWSTLGPTGGQLDLPPICQIKGLSNISGDWNMFKRLYGCAGQAGFVFYDVAPDKVPPLRTRLIL